jgi:hypothetical protein
MVRRGEIDQRMRIVFRGSTLDGRQLNRIREIVERGGPPRTRQELAREVCRAFRWRRPNGTWAVRGARDLLIRLEEAGLTRLPAARRAQGRPNRKLLEAAAAVLSPTGIPMASEPSLPEGGRQTLVVRPVCAEEVLGWRAHMERFHYLGDAALVGESLRYVAHLDGEMVALLSWGAASLRNGPRDRYVGWDEASRKAKLGLVVNNARFLILPWSRRPHLASRVLGANLRRLSRDWEQVYGHRVVLAETFVDTSRFRGTCYRASNWVCVGETQGWSKSGRAYRFHGQPKSVWLYALRRDFREQLRAAADTCARQEGFMAIDVNKLPLEGQGGLFDILGCPTRASAAGYVTRSRACWPRPSPPCWPVHAASPPWGNGRPNNPATRSSGWAPSAASRRASGPIGACSAGSTSRIWTAARGVGSPSSSGLRPARVWP